jgi:hypothetical protein
LGIPFSIGDCLYILLIFFVLKWFGTKENPGKKVENNSLTIFRFISIFYLFFLLWALNYYRKPLFEKWKLKKNTQILIYYYLQKKMIVKQMQSNDNLQNQIA